MKRAFMHAILFLLVATPVYAQFRRVEMTVFGMD